MSCYILFDNIDREKLFPFTATRAVGDILCGAVSNKERWSSLLNAPCFTISTDLINTLTERPTSNQNYLYINGRVIADDGISNAIKALPNEHLLVHEDGSILAYNSTVLFENIEQLHSAINSVALRSEYNLDIIQLINVWDIFSLNGAVIAKDFAQLQSKNTTSIIPEYVHVIGDVKQLIIESGAKVLPCIINVQSGPVYIAKGAEVMEGCMIRGPLVMQQHSVLKMGAKVYGPTTIGAGSKVGGEVNNVVFFENSNKGHDGFLGNAVIGAWCNLGADTNCSNLKNNYDTVKIWSVAEQKLISTGLQFCGLLMGDHSKCGINTMFNTGTVVGVSANIFGTPFPPKFIPSFTWGGVNEAEKYRLDKAIETANRMMERRNEHLDNANQTLFASIYNEIKY